MSGFEAARQSQFASHQRKQLTDQEPVFLLVPATDTNLKHFAAKEQKSPWVKDPLFRLGACVGVTCAPVVCGVIVVGRPALRGVGDAYDCEILACFHDLVPGIREWLHARAILASRALGFQRLLAQNKEDGQLFLEGGFVEAKRGDRWRGWMLDLAHTGRLEDEPPVALPPAHEGLQRSPLPGKPPTDSIDV